MKAILEQSLLPLRKEGLFVSVSVCETDPTIINVTSSIYIRDIDEETGTIDILEEEDGECKGCQGISRPFVHGSIPCPFGCGNFTKPWSLKKKDSHVSFRIFGKHGILCCSQKKNMGDSMLQSITKCLKVGLRTGF
jgi:hypothetical protein